MKKFHLMLLIAASVTFTSCIDILEEMFLNKDGSGKYVMTIDMSAIMDESTRSMLESFDQKEEGEEEEEEEMEKKAPMEQDTTFHFKDLPADKRGELSRPDFYNKVSMKLQASESKELMIISYILDFDNAGDIDYFLQNMDKLMSSMGDEEDAEENPFGKFSNGLGGGNGGLLPSGSNKLFEFSSKMLKRTKAPAPDEEAMAGEEMQMMKMFMNGATYRTIYHFPGKVKSATNPNAKIDGKTVTIEADVMDVMEGKADLSTDIKFKKK